jgi:hypothetical protein
VTTKQQPAHYDTHLSECKRPALLQLVAASKSHGVLVKDAMSSSSESGSSASSITKGGSKHKFKLVVRAFCDLGAHISAATCRSSSSSMAGGPYQKRAPAGGAAKGGAPPFKKPKPSANNDEDEPDYDAMEDEDMEEGFAEMELDELGVAAAELPPEEEVELTPGINTNFNYVTRRASLAVHNCSNSHFHQLQ